MSNDLERLLIQKASATSTPIKAALELTPLCNLNCKMCYVRHSVSEVQACGGLKPVSYWINLIPEMKKMGVLFVTLIGGEPFTYSGLQVLYESLINNGFYVSLTTNATMLASGVPQWLKEAPPRYVTVSLYGASDATYEKVTGNPEGFSQTMAGLNNLLMAGIPVKMSYIVVPQNEDDMEAVFSIKKQYRIPMIASAYCFPRVRAGKKLDFERLSAQQCAKDELRIQQLKNPDQYEKLLRYLSAESFKQNTYKHTDRMYCHAGSSTFWMTWQGKMIPCGMMTEISVDSVQRSLQESWELLKQEVSLIRTASKCASCDKREICESCPAIMEAETGRIDGCPDYICQVMDEMVHIAGKM